MRIETAPGCPAGRVRNLDAVEQSPFTGEGVAARAVTLPVYLDHLSPWQAQQGWACGWSASNHRGSGIEPRL